MCQKKKFTKAAAESLLRQVQSKKVQKKCRWRREQNLYQCPHCNWWHMTSQKPGEYRRRK